MIKVTYSYMKMFYVVYHHVQQMDEMYKTHRETVSPERECQTWVRREWRGRERENWKARTFNTLTTGEFRSQRTRKTKGQ